MKSVTQSAAGIALRHILKELASAEDVTLLAASPSLILFNRVDNTHPDTLAQTFYLCRATLGSNDHMS